ncbi:MmcQ/YjbR family DNA-binding protein [Ligilactobacillus ruminis]|nr:MmcQ/YjbR family DNA-binding protein [Ligilactobacillus ruminis]
MFKAYHMNKENCVTVGLDGIVSDEKLKSLVRMSYYLASGK